MVSFGPTLFVLFSALTYATYGHKTWRDDRRCGENYPLPDGSPAECDPDGEYPCCSPKDWCGNTNNHCTCSECIDYRNPRLQCITRQSVLSGDYDDSLVRMSCRGTEQMTGCSSHLPGHTHGTRDGEFIEVASDGRVSCVARAGAHGSEARVRAYARCCTREGLTCGYATGTRSGRGDDDTDRVSFVRPGTNTQLTGCSASTFWQNIDGAKPNSDISTSLTDIKDGQCIAQNGAGGKGVWAHAVYCSAPGLHCKAKWSTRGHSGRGSIARVSCDHGWTLTGCNSYTFYKVNDGAYISAADECIAVNGGNGNYIYAVAICCHD